MLLLNAREDIIVTFEARYPCLADSGHSSEN